MISVFCLEWLRHGWFFISLFMDFDSLYYSVTSLLTLWAFSYTHFMLTWNVKLLLCSLDLVACIIIALSCILLLVRLDLFTTCGMHWLDYSCFLCGLICSPLCVIMLWLWPIWFRHGVRLQYRCDFQLVGLYPCFEMSYPCDPYFSCCGWWVGFACDRWWLFLLLWLLCLGHMCFDLPCCFSGLYLSSGGVGVFGRIWHLVWFALVQGEYDLLHWKTSCLGYYPFEFETWCLLFIWLGLRGSLWFALVWRGVGALTCILYILLFSCIFFILT
jgi:hypothetical protein